jgi:hypothetical protein
MVGAKNEYLHLGGDEVKTACWDSVAAIKKYTVDTYGNSSDAAYRLLQVEWTRAVSTKAATNAMKIPVLWQSTPAGPNDAAWAPATANLPNNSVYMSWLNEGSVIAYAKAGQKVVTTNGFYVAAMGNGGWKSVYDAQVAPTTGLTPTELSNILGGQACIWGEQVDGTNLPVLAFQVSMGAAENFWGKWGGNGEIVVATDAEAVANAPPITSVNESDTAALVNESATYWWEFGSADCGGDDVPGDCPGTPDKVACCSGGTVAECKAKCMNTTTCGGFNFPHGILKKKDCLSHKGHSTTSLYVMSDKPQPPPPPAPAPPQWEGSWSLEDRYNRFLCHLRNYGVASPPQMPCDCRLMP